MLAIVMATSVWGPMRLSEIESLIGRTFHSSRTGRAARTLERLGVCVCTYRGKRNITVEMDRCHPMFIKLRRLARKMYAIYIEPHAMSLPIRRAQQIRYNVPAVPKRDAATIDHHLFGDRPQVRVLHLLVEALSLPAFMIAKLLGTSHAVYKAIHDLETAGLVKTRRKGVDLYVRLDTSWPAHLELQILLKSLNEHLPEYAAMAAVYRLRRKAGLYSWTTRLRRGYRRGRRFVVRAKRSADVR